LTSAYSSLGWAEEWVNTWSATIAERAVQAQTLAERVAAMTISASNSDESVCVTVDGSGVITDLRLDDRILRRPGAEVASAILTVMRAAQGGLTERVIEAAESTVGTATETGRAVIESFERRFPRPGGESGARTGRGGR
jgi:DNA-binding protein YbaB